MVGVVVVVAVGVGVVVGVVGVVVVGVGVAVAAGVVVAVGVVVGVGVGVGVVVVVVVGVVVGVVVAVGVGVGVKVGVMLKLYQHKRGCKTMITWNIKDRKSGQSIIIPNPTTPGEYDTLRMILKNCAEMGNQRHGDGMHLHPSLEGVHRHAEGAPKHNLGTYKTDIIAQPLSQVA